jgi:hypothetical protein
MVGVLAGTLAIECHADLNGNDDFNDNSKDPARWGTDSNQGVGLLTETNGRLEYTTGGTPGDDSARRPWILKFGSHTQNWEVQIDVGVPHLSLGTGQSVLFGLLVFPGTNFNTAITNRLTIDLAQNQNGPPPGGDEHKFRCNLAVNKVASVLATTLTTSTSAAVRVAFDANTKVLSTFYDEDGAACGYSWTLLGATNLDTAWNLTGSSVFGVAMFGSSVSNTVASADSVFGDNFCASSGPTPTLAINLAAGSVVLSWSTNAPACHLESAGTLAPPTCWHVITNTPGIVSTNIAVTNTISSAQQFYRLSR